MTEPQPQRAPALTEVVVEKLLGEFDHRVSFPEPWDFVIIYGPNGVGKTRLLELVRATMRLDFSTILSTPFERLILRFGDGHAIRLESLTPAHASRTSRSPSRPDVASAGTGTHRKFNFNFKLLSNGKTHSEFKIDESNTNFALIDWLVSNTSWRQIDDRLWEDRTDGELATLDVLADRFPYVLGRIKQPKMEVPKAIRDFLGIAKCRFIETQRLVTRQLEPQQGYRRGNAASRPTVQAYAEDLRRRLESALSLNSRFTQTLDRTFPRRILASREQLPVFSDEEIRSRYVQQNKKREQLASLGLIEAQAELPLPNRALKDWESYVLSTYLDDTDKKLATFEDLLQKVELLMDIVNSRFLRKNLNVSAESGLVIKGTGAGKALPLESLSSGEQHELILFYDLLFRSDPGATVLIDEPEISLHIVWQQRFLMDLTRVASAASLRFVIATHSPQLIHKSWHRTVELAGSEDIL